MQTIAKFVGRTDRASYAAPKVELPLDNTFIGIEVEMDSDNSTPLILPTEYTPEWQRKRDGSLVNGYEYVLDVPLKGQEIVNAIYKLYKKPTEVGRTYTGSTHIHIDMQDHVDVEAIRTLVLLTYAFESVLYAAGDISRQWCGFANRLSSAPSEMVETILTLESVSEFRRAMDNFGRYYGLNLAALTRFGSVEFRYFPTAETPEELVRWVKLVQLFKKAAIEIGTTDKLIELLSSEEGYNSFVATYFSDYPNEVAATDGYDRIRCLINKALIISKTQNKTKKKKAYTDTLLTGRYKNIVTRAMRRNRPKPLTKGFKLNIVHSSPSAPTVTQAIASYEANHGVSPDMTILIHTTGGVYYGNTQNRLDWVLERDMCMYHQLPLADFLACIPSIIEYSENNLSETITRAVRERLSQAATYIQPVVDSARIQGLSVEAVPPVAYENDDDDHEEQEESFEDDFEDN